MNSLLKQEYNGNNTFFLYVISSLMGVLFLHVLFYPLFVTADHMRPVKWTCGNGTGTDLRIMQNAQSAYCVSDPIVEDFNVPVPAVWKLAENERRYIWLQYGGHIYDPTVSVQYGTRLVKIDDSDNDIGTVACGGTVPKGTRVKIQIIPQARQDVFWFNTGGAFDTPYGIWAQNAELQNPENVLCVDDNFVYQHGRGTPWFKSYATFVVNPPVTNINVTGASCEGSTSDSERVCNLDIVGSVSFDTTFSNVFGYFYGANKYRKDRLNNTPSGICYARRSFLVNHAAYKEDRTTGRYPVYKGRAKWENQPKIEVPDQTISCSVTVEDVSGEPPATPTVYSNGSCVIGSAFTLNINSTDPDNDAIRYGIDWDNNGTVDQFTPATGYVPSGTTQSLSRTYTTEGTKTIRVLAQDEKGLTSGWVTASFECGSDPEGGGVATTEVAISVTGGESGANTGGVARDPDGIATNEDLFIKAIPSLVVAGQTSKVHWSAVDVVSCTVSGSNGDGLASSSTGLWDGLLSPAGGVTTSAIAEPVTYTLRCLDKDGKEFSKDAKVLISPTWNEF